MRMMVAQNKHFEGNSDGSQGSVNGTQKDRRDDLDAEKDGERLEGQPNWQPTLRILSGGPKRRDTVSN